MENCPLSAVLPDTEAARRYSRHRLPLPVSILLGENQENEAWPEPMSLQDISLTGLYFMSDRPYESGRHLRIQITLGERDYRIRVLVQRSHRTQNDGGAAYGTAVLFVRGDNIHPFLADLAAFLNRPGSPPVN